MIRAVFFDIDNTLYDSTELAYRARMAAVNAMIEAGLTYPEKDFIYETLIGIVKERGPNFDKHFDVLVERLGRRGDAHIIAAGVVAYHDAKYAYLKPLPDAVPVLLDLSKEYKLGVITNGVATKQWEKLIRLGLQHLFKKVVISEKVGVEKPDKKIFEEALSISNCSPKYGVMVGDKVQEDVIGAKAVGMKTIWLKRGPFSKVEPSKEEEKPDHVIKNFSELPGILGGM